MKFFQASTLFAILALTVANPVPENNVQALAVVERSVQDNVHALPLNARSISGPIESRDLMLRDDSNTARVTYRLSRLGRTGTSQLLGVTFTFIYESATRWTVKIASSLDRSINVYVKNLATQIDVVAQALSGGQSTSDEHVPLQGGDDVELTWAYVGAEARAITGLNARGITGPIEDRAVEIAREVTKDATQNLRITSTPGRVLSARVAGVFFKFLYESSTRYTVYILNGLDRSINVYVKSLATHIDIVGQALSGGQDATDEHVPLQVNDYVELSWSYV